MFYHCHVTCLLFALLLFLISSVTGDSTTARMTTPTNTPTMQASTASMTPYIITLQQTSHTGMPPPLNQTVTPIPTTPSTLFNLWQTIVIAVGPSIFTIIVLCIILCIRCCTSKQQDGDAGDPEKNSLELSDSESKRVATVEMHDNHGYYGNSKTGSGTRAIPGVAWA